MFYSIQWEKLPFNFQHRLKPNWIQVRVTLLDKQGTCCQKTRQYEEWIGVCTSRIGPLIDTFKLHFPSHEIRHVHLSDTRKILPYFEERLAKNKLDYRSKPFYKVYTTANHEDVGRFFHRYKIAYYSKQDWLVRIYIDFCTLYQSDGFYYKWYHVSDDSLHLLESFQMLPDHTTSPHWTIGAFDLETVPMDGALDRIPSGMDSSDSVVMISLFKWNPLKGLQKWILYLLPDGLQEALDQYPHSFAYTSETSLLRDFHCLIQDCQVLTGYNVNGFDIPCLFARLLWLKQYDLLSQYSSRTVGQEVVTTFQNKLVLDLYYYFRIFANYDLPGFKLDDVARVKLKGYTKVPIKSTGLWFWYTHRPVSKELFQCDHVQTCHRVLQPHQVSVEQFGTFRTYLDYCYRDTELVYLLFKDQMVLEFLVGRSNFTSKDAVDALHLGNSRFLLELFKTYGTCLGFFFNDQFLSSPIDSSKFKSMFGSKNQTYQGALNFCIGEQVYQDVSVMDFTSMYPSALLSSNLCYGTCTILTRDEWFQLPKTHTLTTIPYRVHSDADFECDGSDASQFRYPTFDPSKDEFAIVINTETQAFLPCIVLHFLKLRKHHQAQWKTTQDVYHYNAQLCIKILINSLYGVMANKDSCLSYLVIAMTIVTLSRYQLLGSYHYMKRLGYNVCYADTDSLMVHQWPQDDCDAVNRYLNLNHVELKYEQRMKRLLILSKKRYIYETLKGEIVTKGFQKRINDVVQFMSNRILNSVWIELFETPDKRDSPFENEKKTQGWSIWVDTLLQIQYMCRDAKKYSITRKTKALDEYKSKSCVSVRILERYPEKANTYIDYTYSLADVAVKEASKWVMDAEECEYTNFEQLFMSQKKIFCTLMNMAFWQLRNPVEACDMVLNTMRWKNFVHAELVFRHENGKRNVVMLVERGVKYTFKINEIQDNETKKRGRRRKDTTVRSEYSESQSNQPPKKIKQA